MEILGLMKLRDSSGNQQQNIFLTLSRRKLKFKTDARHLRSIRRMKIKPKTFSGIESSKNLTKNGMLQEHI
jgi:hypothetical protein